MDHQNDPLWKMGQQAQEQQMQRAQQIAQGWANKERYYQGRAVDAAVQLPLALIGKMLKFIPSVFCIYFVPTIGAGLARLAFAGAAAIQQDKGFFSLGIGLGVLDAIIYLFGAAIVAGTVGAFVWAFSTVTFTGRILALFYLYSLGIWFIHHWEADAGWKAAGTWFFCVLFSSLVEGIALWYRNRRAGVSPAF
jgi:hypothetical protein